MHPEICLFRIPFFDHELNPFCFFFQSFSLSFEASPVTFRKRQKRMSLQIPMDLQGQPSENSIFFQKINEFLHPFSASAFPSKRHRQNHQKWYPNYTKTMLKSIHKQGQKTCSRNGSVFELKMDPVWVLLPS